MFSLSFTYAIIILLVITVCIGTKEYFENGNGNGNGNGNDPCDYNLSDEDYLKHMIPHHKVAVDISLLLQKTSYDPVMQGILRHLIWVQNYEITLMKTMLEGMPSQITTDHKTRGYIPTVANSIPPNKIGLTNTYCDPNFFDPEGHMEHMKHMDLTDKTYIEHMIPHHQVAVDMSKKILKHTENDMMISLAYRIIRSQQNEIVLLTDLLKNKYIHKSGLVVKT
jgi:uncharacterized protein (DUF305 family)